MVLWFVFAAMAIAAAGLLVSSFLRQPDASGERADYELEVCRAQLRELERDFERGVVTEDEVEAAKVEIQRRILAADSARGARTSAAASPLDQALPVVLGALLPLAAFGLYAWLGSPGLTGPAVTVAERPASGQQQSSLPDVQGMISQLKGRLAEQPQDIDGWITLGQSYMTIGRYMDAVSAFDRALEIRGNLPFVNASRGEALVFAAEGRIPQEARAAFRKTLEDDPAEPRARFYLAMAAEQDGEPRKALDGLTALLAEAPPGADWARAVRHRATVLAEQLGEDPAEVLPVAPVVAAATGAERSAAETAADPEELAARLAENPKDYQGWIALARLRAAAGDEAGARAALQSGAEAYPSAPFVQQQLQQAAAELGLENGGRAPRGPTAEDIQAAQNMSESEQQEMIRGMVDGLAARLETEPEDVEGWRMLARSYGVLGETDKAAEVHKKIITMVPEDAGARVDYAEALIAAGNPTAPPPQEAVAALEQALVLDEANPDALFHLGEAARRKGDVAGAGLYWQRLLDQLPQGTEERSWLQQRIDELE
ncbi:MAG: c-type cytochrome biogenesis protein CcmI [Kiloniellales bacterium]|nr:c-type cytochrome biogenesis protein CcmI [Kiloniellales bacterium]